MSRKTKSKAEAKILYVEDNPQNMRLVRKMLKREVYTLLEAVDGLTGVKMAEKEMPDLILMDINLPDIDGIEATRRIKEIAALADVPIVALTSNATYGDKDRILAGGLDGYMPKPVNMTELIKLIEDHLPEWVEKE